ncbi:hypothetical protein TSMEX_008516 [Taenia solium]|eukprot:TsM_000375400 transcript=TsM_000375400 gene=TsM_000375400
MKAAEVEDERETRGKEKPKWQEDGADELNGVNGIVEQGLQARIDKVHRWRCNIGAMQKGVFSGSDRNDFDDTVTEVATSTKAGVRWTDDSTLLLLKMLLKWIGYDCCTLIWQKLPRSD